MKSAAVFVVLTLLSLGAVFSVSANDNHSSASQPAYANVGAFALYSGNGGFIAFLSGVSANMTYTVTNVFPNNTMTVLVNGTMSLGTEASTPPSTINKTFSDSVYSPKVLPAVSPLNLTSQQIVFQNITCSFVKNAEILVPAGDFNATEFQGKDQNGTTVDFWFDRSTGLALQMSEAASYFQLIQSNIAVPLSTQSSFAAELPYIAIFIVGWAGAGLLFYAVIRHYSHKGKRESVGSK